MATRKFETDGVRFTVTTQPSRNGEVIVELKMTCDPTHPTGVTTTMLQQVTARQLRGIGEPTNRQIDYFLSVSFPEHRRKASKRGATDERFLKQVAYVYLRALRKSMPPTKAVQRWEIGRAHV